jgi:hypothetical protein
MAKSESTAVEQGAYDPAETHAISLKDLGEQTGLPATRWVLQMIKGQTKTGRSDKGPWTKVGILFSPIRPENEDEIDALELDLDDLPQAEHVVFLKNKQDLRNIRDLLILLGANDPEDVESGMMEARGGMVSAFVRPDGEFNGRPQYRFASFRAVEQ